MLGPQDPISCCLDAGDAPPAAPASIEALAERVRELETRLSVQEDLVAACLERGTARAIQSLGAVVEYLTKRGLIDEEDLQAFIESEHRVIGFPAPDGSVRAVLDIHQWLSWRRNGRARRLESRPASPMSEEILDVLNALSVPAPDASPDPPGAA